MSIVIESCQIMSNIWKGSNIAGKGGRLSNNAEECQITQNNIGFCRMISGIVECIEYCCMMSNIVE